jgi:tetratricopeptide (TPR) repeat protein
VLGQDIDPLEWHAACARAGIEAPDELADALIVQRLARADEAGPEFGWGFVHGMLREAIERVASERAPEGWRAAHRLCADMLGETDAVGNAHRIGRHLLAAGDPAGALEPLLVASSSPGIDPRTAEAFLIERERAMDLLRLPADDPRRVANAIARAEVLLHQGREGNAAQYASEALELAEQHGWDGALAGALSALAEVARLKHRFGPSLQYRRRAARHAIAAGDVRREVEAISGIGRLYLDVGNWPQAQEAYTRALERAKEADLFAEAAECLTSLGYIATKTGDDDASEVRFKQAAWYVQRSGSQVQQGNLLNALADLARKRGAWAEAERHARESLRLYQATGTRAARVVALNLSLFQVLQGKYGTARLTIERALDDEASGPESAAFTAGCLAVLLPCLAAMAEWDAWYRHLDAIGRTFTGDLFVDDDTLAMLELAARLSTNNDDPDRPRAAWTLVWRLWRAMGRDDQAARVRAELDALLPRGAGS